MRKGARGQGEFQERVDGSLWVGREIARADAITDFKASYPFIDACAIYYGDGFEDCLK